MKPCLADVNVFLPLLVRHHEHHEIALRWFDALTPGEAVLCRFVQLALVRLLSNRTLMQNDKLPASSAWNLIEELLEDERMEFAAEPAPLGSILPKFLQDPVPTGKLVSDAYLAAFSVAASLRLVSVDKGFKQFRGLDLILLSS